MKREVCLGLFVLLLMGVFSSSLVSATSTTDVIDKGVLFYGDGCPHCAKVESFIEANGLEDSIVRKEIYHNAENAEEFNRVCAEKGIGLMDRGVPFLLVNDSCFIGDQQIISYLENSLVGDGGSASQSEPVVRNGTLTLPMVIGAALVDAVNPCAFAVLLILMMTVLATGRRKKALYSGLSFSLAIFISYFLMGLGIYSIVASFQTSQIFIKIIGLIAMVLGLLNLKDFFWYGKGFLMEVPLSWRPRMKKIIRGVTNPFGAFFIGILVSLFLLPCTSGPYIVIIAMLGNQATYYSAIRLLILYNLIFILPMILISVGTYFGMNIKEAEKKRSKNLRWLHLIAGIIMLIMGIYLLLGL